MVKRKVTGEYRLRYGSTEIGGTLADIALAATLVRAKDAVNGEMIVSSADGTHWINFKVGDHQTTDTSSSTEFRDKFVAAALEAVKKHLPGVRQRG